MKGGLKSETARGAGEIWQEAVAGDPSRRGWAEAEVIWRQRHRTFGHFGRGGPWDRQVERPPAVPPQQTQETLRVRWSGFKRWVCSCPAGEHHQQHPHPLMPQLRNGQRRIRLRRIWEGTDSTGWRTRGTWCQRSQEEWRVLKATEQPSG